MFKKNQKKLLFIIFIASVLLYLAGVFSGLYANKIFESRIGQDIGFLKTYVDSSALDLKNIQLQHYLIDNFEEENQCKVLDIYLKNLHSQLHSFWEVLPERLEEYDKIQTPSSEYIALKREYIRLSLRVWLTARKNYYQCNSTEFLPILYFYSKDCDLCVQQGREFDRFKDNLVNQTSIIFPIDLDFEDDTVFLLKTYYNITKVPAIIIDNKLAQGQIVSEDAIKSMI